MQTIIANNTVETLVLTVQLKTETFIVQQIS